MMGDLNMVLGLNWPFNFLREAFITTYVSLMIMYNQIKTIKAKIKYFISFG